MIDAYGYVRSSTSEQILTIESQREMIIKYCDLCNINLIEIFEDSATTSKTPLEKRSGGKRIISGMNQKKVQALIVTAIDRPFRKTSEALNYIEHWSKQNQALYILNFGGNSIDTSTATGKLLFTLMAGVAEWERDRISERTSEVLQQKARNKQLTTRPDRIPYGYKIASGTPGQKNVMLESSPKEQRHIQQIYQYTDDGMDATDIAKLFRKRKVKYRTSNFLARHIKYILSKR